MGKEVLSVLPLVYIAFAILYGTVLSLICWLIAIAARFTAISPNIDVTTMAQGGFLMGVILGLFAAREWRKLKPLWKSYMREWDD